MMGTITMKIDDQDIVTQKESTILEAALANKIYIPHLCHHSDLKPAGSCRVCLVELDNGQIVTSCRMPVKEGMVIKTNSPEVDKIRRPVVELIVANHHMDCKNCLKKGQCQLQKIMAYMKIDKKKIQETMKLPEAELPLDDSNPFFIRDHNKCVLCGICVRTCQKIAKINAIDFAWRGNTSKIAAFGDKPITESSCVSCGECVVRCPVGALAVRKPQRPAHEVKTVCPYCGAGCSIFLGTREGFIVNVRGDKESPVNNGNLCVKGRYGLSFVHSPDRLTAPLMRQGKSKSTGMQMGFIEVSWDKALMTVANKLKKFKGEEIAVIASARCTNEENYIAQKFARVVLGSNNVDTSVRLSDAPSQAALHIVNAPLWQRRDKGDSKYNIENSSCILVVGADVTRSHPVPGLRIKKAVENGAKLIVISPNETDLCRSSDLWLNPYPGSDLALITGMCSVIVEEGLSDNAFIEEHADNFEEFRESLEDFPPGRVERITGVSRDVVEEAARIYAKGKPATIVWGEGITQYSHGTNNVLSLLNLSILTGNIEHASGLFPLWGQNNSLGACLMGCLPDYYPGYQPISNPKIRERIETVWGRNLPPDPGLTLTEILDATREGKIKALYIMGTDLATRFTPPRKVEKALKKAKLIVCQDIFLNETAKYAHVILPAASFAEKDGTFTNTEGMDQEINRAIDSVGSSLPDWKILCDLAKKLNIDGFDFGSTKEILSEISTVTSGLPVQKGRFRFRPLQYEPPAEVADIDYPLILTTAIDLYSGGLLSEKAEGLGKLKAKDIVYVNPKDAADFEIEDGASVKIISRHGKIKSTAKLTNYVPCGVISMYLTKDNINRLIDPIFDPIAKTPEAKICAVKIIRQ